HQSRRTCPGLGRDDRDPEPPFPGPRDPGLRTPDEDRRKCGREAQCQPQGRLSALRKSSAAPRLRGTETPGTEPSRTLDPRLELAPETPAPSRFLRRIDARKTPRGLP